MNATFVLYMNKCVNSCCTNVYVVNVYVVRNYNVSVKWIDSAKDSYSFA